MDDDEDFGLESFGEITQLAGSSLANGVSVSAASSNAADSTSQPQRAQSVAWSEVAESDFDLYEDMQDGTFASNTSAGLASGAPSSAASLRQPSSQIQADVPDSATANGLVSGALEEDHSTGSAVFIGNMQWWTTDAEVEAACAAFGHVKSVLFTEDKTNGRSKGYARVHFAEPGAASLCKTGLNGRVLNEKACVVTLAGPGPPPVPSASAPSGHSVPTGAPAGRGFGRGYTGPNRVGAMQPAPPAFPPGRAQGMVSIGARPPDMFRPPPMGPGQIMPSGISAPMMGRGTSLGMGMRNGAMDGPVLPPMMPRGMPNNIPSGMPPPGGMRASVMGGPGSAMPGGMMRPPFGGPSGMPSLFTGAPLSAGMPSRVDDNKRKRL